MEKQVLQKIRQRKLRLFGCTFFMSNSYKYAGWFRFMGIGLRWKHESIGLFFSERQGYTKYIKIGKWIISTCRN